MMGKFFLLAFVIFQFSCLTTLGQELYPVRGTVYVREGKATKVNLSIFSGTGVERIPVDIQGNFVVYLSWNNDFQFLFSKPGYISKKIIFSTQVSDEVDKNSIYPYTLLVELTPTFPDVDTVFFKKPVAKIKYSEEKRDFDYDLDYELVVKKKMANVKKQYKSWKKSIETKPTNSSKEAQSKEREESALFYQKSVELNPKGKISAGSSTLPSKVVKPIVKDQSPFDLPPLKDHYPEGKSIEIYALKGKEITRVIIKKGNYQKVLLKVKHNWGGMYFFVQESPFNYRNISQYNFEKATKI